MSVSPLSLRFIAGERETGRLNSKGNEKEAKLTWKTVSSAMGKVLKLVAGVS